MRSVKKARVKLFRLSFLTGSPPVEILSRKKLSRKSSFFDSVRKLDLGFSRKKTFSTDKSDCIRNDLTSWGGRVAACISPTWYRFAQLLTLQLPPPPTMPAATGLLGVADDVIGVYCPLFFALYIRLQGTGGRETTHKKG